MPNQMLSRLPITLTKLQAENVREKLKNAIRQLLPTQQQDVVATS